MSTTRIALANIPFAASPEAAVTLVKQAIAEAAQAKADIVCFPECYVPGYRAPHTKVPPLDEKYLERAWPEIANAAAASRVAVILGTERVADGKPHITALVID